MNKPTVCATEWNVTAQTGTDIKGAVLHVFRIDDGRYVVSHPEHNGKTFENSDAAFDYALSAGLTRLWEGK